VVFLRKAGLEDQMALDALCRKLLGVCLFGRTRHKSVCECGALYLCRLRAVGRVISVYSLSYMERHGTAYTTSARAHACLLAIAVAKRCHRMWLKLRAARVRRCRVAVHKHAKEVSSAMAMLD